MSRFLFITSHPQKSLRALRITGLVNVQKSPRHGGFSGNTPWPSHKTTFTNMLVFTVGNLT